MGVARILAGIDGGVEEAAAVVRQNISVRQDIMAQIEFIMTTQDSIGNKGPWIAKRCLELVSRGVILGGDGQWTLDAGRFAEKAEEQSQ